MPKTCSVTGCSSKHDARGFCRKHLARFYKYGDPLAGDRNHASPAERFWRRVDRTGTCWIWEGKSQPGGYGRFQTGGKGSPHVGAHRFSYELHNGPIPDGAIVMHACDNPLCVNPAHLSIGTQSENIRDMMAKGRQRGKFGSGEAHPMAALDADKVRTIRADTTTSNPEFARRYGVSVTVIRLARIGRTWKHVE